MAFIITGMHRSGTSLTASLFQELGINIGGELVPADRFNPRGYFEDIDFLEFQRRVLQLCCDPNDPGWHDWGWTVNETLNPELFYQYQTEAEALLSQRISRQNIWGWKDPRTTLMLDFWHQLLPESYYLLVFRYPWDVADSIGRLNAPIFNDHPEYILPIWCYYNQKLLNFYQKYPDQCILFCVNHIDRLESLVELCRHKFKLRIDGKNIAAIKQKIYDRDLFHQLPPGQQIVDDRTMTLLKNLQSHADL